MNKPWPVPPLFLDNSHIYPSFPPEPSPTLPCQHRSKLTHRAPSALDASSSIICSRLADGGSWRTACWRCMRCQVASLSTTGSASLAPAGLSQAPRLVDRGVGVRRRALTGHKSLAVCPVSGAANRHPIAQASRPDGHSRCHGTIPIHPTFTATTTLVGHCGTLGSLGFNPRYPHRWLVRPAAVHDHQLMSCPLAAAMTRCWSPGPHLVAHAYLRCRGLGGSRIHAIMVSGTPPSLHVIP